MRSKRSRLDPTTGEQATPAGRPRRWNAYFLCGFAGYLAGLVLVIVLGSRADLAMPARLVVALVPPLSFLFAVRASHIVTGQERIVFYELAILAVGATAVVAALIGAPVALMTDLAMLGVGAFLAFGRLGCAQVGCCHGRRARAGVIYGEEQTFDGFPTRLVGLPLFPIQLADALLSATLVVIGVTLVVRGAAPGLATCAYAAGYGVGRFGLEFARGDPDRPIALGVSEAQWTALVTTVGAALWHPRWWSVAAAILVATATLGLMAARRWQLPEWLWLASPKHVAEIADILGRFSGPSLEPTVTREGLKLSAARLPDGRLDVVVSRVSRPARPTASVRPLSPRLLQAIAFQLGRPWTAWSIVPGHAPGLLHLLVGDRSEPPAPVPVPMVPNDS